MSQNVQVIALCSGLAGAPIVNERLAGVVGIIPGILVRESAGNVIINATAGKGPALFALPNLPVSGSIDTAYANGVTVQYGAFTTGQEVNALVAAGTAAIADGAPLTCHTDGTLITGTDANAIAYAMEAVDNSGGATTARIKVRIA